jgi:aspartyl-tRNA(Asn)/glutamyl-tRNA(Gln) amidotransferase subunit B
MPNSYETVIGLEVHLQLNTRSKVFCADSAAFGGAPNTHISTISLAHPGVLPRTNREVIDKAIRLGLGLGCDITPVTTFDRKNYFYADLPKGYQVTQDRAPICRGGQVRLPDGKVIRIHHIHLEEDAGKSMHDQDPADSLIDLNRAGVPLLEIVSEPDLCGPEEVAAYMEAIRRIGRWLDVSDGNMEEGSLRCDVNISIRPVGATYFGNRCEVKNVNSMRFARRAIQYEVERQIAIVEQGGTVLQETRGFDVTTGLTYSLREKEDAHDYRYFPEPDLPPIRITTGQLEAVKSSLPALPDALLQKFQDQYGLTAYDAAQLTQDKETAFYVETLIDAAAPPKAAANLIINKLRPWADETRQNAGDNPVSPATWTAFLKLIESNQISASTAYQKLFPALLEQPAADPAQLAAQLNLLQDNSSDTLEPIVMEVISRFPDKVAAYKKGQKGLLGFFMGEVMKAAKGKADPKAATKLVEEQLGK